MTGRHLKLSRLLIYFIFPPSIDCHNKYGNNCNCIIYFPESVTTKAKEVCPHLIGVLKEKQKIGSVCEFVG